MEISGQIEKVLDLVKGTTKDGKEWQKIAFTVKTSDEYNNLYCFDVFGEEKVQNFLKYNKVGSNVKVDFNIKTNEWQGKFFTSLDAWKIFGESKVSENSSKEQNASVTVEEEDDSLPF